MKISAAGRYAVRLMVSFARGKNVVSLKEAAMEQRISIKYAEQIIRKLIKADLLISERGQDGGYKLKKEANKITIYEILLATGDIQKDIKCVEQKCPNLKSCVVVDVFVTLNKKINDYLKSVTLKTLL